MNQYSEQIITIIQLLLGAIAGYGAASLKLGKYMEKIDVLCAKISDLEKDVKNMLERTTRCETKIEERTQNLAATLLKRESPISLSDQGEKLLKQSRSDVFVLRNQENLIQKIKGRNPKTAYDVQEFSKEEIKKFVDDDQFIPLKDYAYNQGIELEAIMIVMGIYLRDIALPQLGYKPEDIDKSDPAQN